MILYLHLQPYSKPLFQNGLERDEEEGPLESIVF